jgi:hypothetical protein
MTKILIGPPYAACDAIDGPSTGWLLWKFSLAVKTVHHVQERLNVNYRRL